MLLLYFSNAIRKENMFKNIYGLRAFPTTSMLCRPRVDFLHAIIPSYEGCSYFPGPESFVFFTSRVLEKKFRSEFIAYITKPVPCEIVTGS